jgi:hypothetical protein
MRVRFSRSARRHRVGKARALDVMEQTEPTLVPAGRYPDDQYVWVGLDNRGIELEIVDVEKPDCLLVIHVMPTHLRRDS